MRKVDAERPVEQEQGVLERFCANIKVFATLEIGSIPGVSRE
jgi:hypothetical protein